MTEREWDESSNAEEMLNELGLDANKRKLRLFLCAVCRSAEADLPDGPLRRAVDVADRDVDGLASNEELRVAIHEAKEATEANIPESLRNREPPRGHYGPIDVFLPPLINLVALNAVRVTNHQFINAISAANAIDHSRGAALIRDLFGNPFRRSNPDSGG
jgi:hypothetical protein